MAGFPAFKEWQAIVGCLEAGEQILILRKGGISEGRSGFEVRTGRFWLFPTAFHAQQSLTKPVAHRHFEDGNRTPPGAVVLSSFADVVAARFVTSWETVAGLDAHHAWTEETVNDRFYASQPPGIHALIVRVYRIQKPLSIPLTGAMGGCRSWIDLPLPFDQQEAKPALDDDAFELRSDQLLRILTGEP